MNNNIDNYLTKLRYTFLSLSIMVMFGLLLISTNPGKTQFKEHLKSEMVENSQQSGIFLRIAARITSAPVAWTINALTDRYDYVFFSIYVVSLPDQEVLYIGVLNHFFRIQ